VVEAVRAFVEAEVRPAASALEHADEYPHALVARLRELGLFGALIPREYGGLGLDVSTYAAVIEELCRGFMSLAGVINSHTMLALIVLHHGTDEQRGRFLPRLAAGAARGGLCLTEPHAGSDVQAIRTVARRHGDHYLVNGTKMFITNGREGNAFALLALTDPTATPRHRGMSCFVIEKGHPGFRVASSIRKLGYKGVDTVELVFEDFAVPAENLVGGVEGRGFQHVMSGLETGRVNIAARAVGVAQAALDEALARVRARRALGATEPPALLADMATRVAGARLITRWAAGMKDRRERCDLEAGLAKLHASESAQQVATDGLRAHGAEGQLTAFTAERHYRDTPLMIIGEGTNEIQRTLIARQLLARDGEESGALVDTRASSEAGQEDRRHLVLAVRRFVDKAVVPVAAEHDAARRSPDELVRALADLGVLGTLVPAEYGGLGLDVRTHVMIVEEIARGSATLAALVSAHLVAAAVVARFGTAAQRERLLPPATRGEAILAGLWDAGVEAEATGASWTLRGGALLVENAGSATTFVARARGPAGDACVIVSRHAPGVVVGAPHETLGANGLGVASVRLDGVTVVRADVLGPDAVDSGEGGPGARALAAARALSRLGAAATAVGIAQAALAASLRYARQRTAFGKPICEHQAVQLKLADMATGITVARLLTDHAAAHADRDVRVDETVAMAKLAATESALTVTLEALRIHGGYGYSCEFPVERYYRDAARLVLTPTTSEEERAILARHLVASA
jgi:alkylation response protein AidB-like acyl-CoA dehydrogenase